MARTSASQRIGASTDSTPAPATSTHAPVARAWGSSRTWAGVWIGAQNTSWASNTVAQCSSGCAAKAASRIATTSLRFFVSARAPAKRSSSARSLRSIAASTFGSCRFASTPTR